ncbi:MAG TPA: hypothetical protein DDX98_12160 [Bacteroidales bacterium]|jgi:hypothetical protein|nr:hypothetical protein [Bacteroidales bacterium]
MKKAFGLIFILSFPLIVLAQDCKVLNEELNNEYTGECKKGVAHGEGTAKGNELTYEGEFKKGLVHGEGTLIREDQTYKGEFDDGMVMGYGSLYIGDSLIKEGYFKGQLLDYYFMGENKSDLAGYRILQDDNLDQAQVRISKSDNKTKLVTIRLSDPKNRSISNINVDERNNGQIANSTFTNSRSVIEINAIDFPFVMTLRYNVSNQSGNFNLPAILKIEIFEPGDWLISITH